MYKILAGLFLGYIFSEWIDTNIPFAPGLKGKAVAITKPATAPTTTGVKTGMQQPGLALPLPTAVAGLVQ